MPKLLLFLFLCGCCGAPVGASAADCMTACLCQKALGASMCRDATVFEPVEARDNALRFSVQAEGGAVDYYCRRTDDTLTLASPVWGHDTVKADISANGDCRVVSIPKTKCDVEPDATCCP